MAEPQQARHIRLAFLHVEDEVHKSIRTQLGDVARLTITLNLALELVEIYELVCRLVLLYDSITLMPAF